MINIYYCIGKKLFDQLLISLISLAKNTSEPLNVINLAVEIPSFDKKEKLLDETDIKLCNSILKASNPKSTFTSIDVSSLFSKELLTGPNLHNKYYSYFVTVRLLADLVPEIPDKVIYLDCDTIINGDIKELWNIDIDKYEFAGRRDLYRITKYLQSGVMLLNMKKIRESGSFEKARRLCREKKFMCYIDMSAINSSCKPKKVIPKKYNCYSGSKKSIIHHVCNTRESKIPFTKKWWHRIKPQEEEFMRTIYPQYAYIYEKLNSIKKSSEEI